LHVPLVRTSAAFRYFRPKWRKDSIFGAGPRQPLDRNGRARFKFLARAHRGAGRLTADHLEVAEVLVSALGDE
jgi:hypothetical protein